MKLKFFEMQIDYLYRETSKTFQKFSDRISAIQDYRLSRSKKCAAWKARFVFFV